MQGRSKATAASILQRLKIFNLVSLTMVCLVVANPYWSFFRCSDTKALLHVGNENIDHSKEVVKLSSGWTDPCYCSRLWLFLARAFSGRPWFDSLL